MGTIAAIDIGSNAIRLIIGQLDSDGEIKIVRKVREPVRLGADVFSKGELSKATKAKAIDAFQKFRSILNDAGVQHFKAVATSAMREAADRDDFVKEVKASCGINIDIIDGMEEGRLIFSAVANRVDLAERVALLIDIGGGSVELTIADHGKIIGSQSFKLGTVRMLQLLESKGLKEKHLTAFIHEHINEAQTFLKKTLGGRHVDFAVGTGGNFECMGKLRVALLHKNSIFSMNRNELRELSDHLETMSIKERIQFLRLRADRADVVVPAAILTHEFMELADVELLMIPYVGLREGILNELSLRVPNSARG